MNHGTSCSVVSENLNFRNFFLKTLGKSKWFPSLLLCFNYLKLFHKIKIYRNPRYIHLIYIYIYIYDIQEEMYIRIYIFCFSWILILLLQLNNLLVCNSFILFLLDWFYHFCFIYFWFRDFNFALKKMLQSIEI